MDLFDNTQQTQPLSEELRPKQLSDVVGQEHLLGLRKNLTLAFKNKALHSMIFWGPPGVGKTTIARLVAQEFNCEFIALSAVYSGLKEVRQAIDLAQSNIKYHQKRTILFIDEIHRFNKAQQDALLPYVENGTILFIGATTENPSFEINSALLSRAKVYQLKSLDVSALIELFKKIPNDRLFNLKWENSAIEFLAKYAQGDARKFLNTIEECSTSLKNNPIVTVEDIKVFLQDSTVRFDKGGDIFYDQISALHKTIRGSHPNAALYWLARMLHSGADPRYIARRLVMIAWEDVGLADPRASEIALNAAQTYERLGSPEGELALAQAVIYLASAPKSNAGYIAFKKIKKFVAEDGFKEVPLHLRNAPTTLLKEFGHGQEYRYAHNEPNAYAAGENYMPENTPELDWYTPTDRGLEIKIKEKLIQLKELDEKNRPRKVD